jgi:hypothetical protein
MKQFGGRLYRPDVAPSEVPDEDTEPAPVRENGDKPAPVVKMALTNPLFEPVPAKRK